MKKIIIDGTSISPGEQVQINALIGRLPTRTPITIPIFVSRAKKDGPVLLLMAGMHGDETNGIEIVRRAIKNDIYHPDRGTVIAIPVFNVYGFINHSRGLPDGKDLNRSFPGSSTGSLASRVAHFFTTQILPQVDYGIDFHTGGASLNNFPQIRGTFDDEQETALARAFAAPFTIHAPFREKSLRKTASKMGKPILVFEGGQTLRLRKQVVDMGSDGIRRVMKFLDMRDDAPEPAQETRILKRTMWIRARMSGMHHTRVRNGEAVKKGEILGYISDPYGQSEKPVKCTENGFIVAINNYPVVNMGDALLHIGTS